MSGRLGMAILIVVAAVVVFTVWISLQPSEIKQIVGPPEDEYLTMVGPEASDSIQYYDYTVRTERKTFHVRGSHVVVADGFVSVKNAAINEASLRIRAQDVIGWNKQ